MKRALRKLAVGWFFLVFVSSGHAEEFTYQGVLSFGGQPADGPFDMVFDLYAAEVGGDSLDTLFFDAVPVADGLVTIDLDFGPDTFEGEDRWLGIRIREAGVGDLVTLEPRQSVKPVPYAHYALSAPMNPVPTVYNVRILDIITGKETVQTFRLFCHDGDAATGGTSNIARDFLVVTLLPDSILLASSEGPAGQALGLYLNCIDTTDPVHESMTDETVLFENCSETSPGHFECVPASHP